MQHFYIKDIVIDAKHLDDNDHVNNVQYVHWVEEMAKEHWMILKDETNYSEDFWVLVDHHIKYKKEVFKNEVLTVKTYPKKNDGLRHPRKVEFYRDNELVVDSLSIWVLIDKHTKKIKKIGDDWLDLSNQ